MPFDNPEETQDETAAPTAFQKSIYPLAGTGVKPLPYLRLSLNGIPPAGTTISSTQNLAARTWQPDTTPKLSLAQRIAALGEYPFSGTFSTQNQSAEGVPKIGIGHRILANASAAILPAKLSQPVRGTPSVSGLNDGHRYGEFFSDFVPAGVSPDNSALAKNQTRRGYPEDLGKAAGTAIGTGTGGALALAAQKIPPASLRKPPIVDASNLVRARSRIHLPQPVPDVKPNLAVTSKNDQKQFKNRLSGLMQGIRETPLPRAVRHLTQDDINEASAVAYSENVNGSVDEYEAIISAILNRVRSGDRQFVDPGQQFTVHNVIHSKKHGNQFQGVTENPNDASGTHYWKFASNHTPAAEKARIAAENIAAHGPTHDQRFFIVLNPRELPGKRQVGNLGQKMHQVGSPVGGVFLYAPEPPAPKPQGAGRHQHGKATALHPHPPPHHR